MKLQIYPSTTISWPDPDDAPDASTPSIDNAHVVIDGSRMTIRRPNDRGRNAPVDVLTDIVMKGTGENTLVTGKSQFMIDHIGLTPDAAEVTVKVDARTSKCLTS